MLVAGGDAAAHDALVTKDAEPAGEKRHHLSDLIGGRHEREDRPLAEAAEHAGFDLGTDLAQPVPEPGGDDFDVDKDIGIDHRPSGLHE